MSIFRIVESVPSNVTHAVGVGSGVTGLAIWAEWAEHLKAIVGLFAAFLAVLGGAFYVGYWALKWYAKWKRVSKGDFTE